MCIRDRFGRVRVIEEDGNYLFCAKDVAEALGYAVPRKAIYDLSLIHI